MVVVRDEERMGKMIQLRNVTVHRGSHTAVRDVSFTIERGSLTVLLGPNGSGKTTLMRALAAAIPYEGTVLVDEQDLRSTNPRLRARRLAYAEQEPAFPTDMTVEHYVSLGRTPHLRRFAGLTTHDHDITRESLERCRITHLRHRKLGGLSGGERRRASLAQALAQTTPVVLLDEPTTALDVGQQQSMLELVDSIRTHQETTFVMALHDLTLARQYGTDVALLKDGALVAAGPVACTLDVESLELHYETTLAQLTMDGVTAIVPRRIHRPM
jgi:iron complex transport system ATP-binding protein